MPPEVRTRLLDPESPEELGQQTRCRIIVDDTGRTIQAVPLE